VSGESELAVFFSLEAFLIAPFAMKLNGSLLSEICGPDLAKEAL
jgi:hypothetical protein